MCHYRKEATPSAWCWLLDCQPFPRHRGLLDQLELEDTVVVFGLARRLVQLRRQHKATIDVAEIPLVAQHPIAFFLFPCLLNFGRDSDLVALDRDVDVFLLHARHFGMEQVTVLGFGHVHLDHYRGRCAFQAHGLEETAEQFVKTGFSPWIVRDKVLHNAFLLNSHATGRTPNCCLRFGSSQKKKWPGVGPLPSEKASGIATFVALRVIFPPSKLNCLPPLGPCSRADL